MVVVGPPDDAHDILQLGQGRQSAEALAERARDLPHERVVERVAVHVDTADSVVPSSAVNVAEPSESMEAKPASPAEE